MESPTLYPPSDLRRGESMDVKFAYTGIRVKNLEASVRFYTSVLGMKEIERFTPPATKGTVVILAMEGSDHQLELNSYPEGSRFATTYEIGEGLDHLGFETADLDKVLAEAKKAGYDAILEMQDPVHRWAYIQDPNGLWVEFFVPPQLEGRRMPGPLFRERLNVPLWPGAFRFHV